MRETMRRLVAAENMVRFAWALPRAERWRNAARIMVRGTSLPMIDPRDASACWNARDTRPMAHISSFHILPTVRTVVRSEAL